MTRAPRRQDALSKGADSGFLVAGVSGVWYLATALTKLQNGQVAARKEHEQAFKSLKEDQEQAVKSLKEDLLAAIKSLKEDQESLKEELLAEIRSSTAGVSRACRSEGDGIR